MEQDRTVSKETFESVVIGLILTFTMAEMILGLTFELALHRPFNGGMFGFLFGLNIVLARIAADRIFRRLGMSRSGKTLEIRARTVAFPEGEVADDDVVEVHCPRSLVRGLLVLCAVICLAMTFILVFMRPPPKGAIIGWLLLGTFGAFGLNAWWDGKTPQVRADAGGILGYPWGMSFRRKFVPWSDVATCEIETHYDTFGSLVITRPILKDSAGRELISLSLLNTEPQDQQRLVKYIRAKLPKTKEDFWE